MNLGFQRCVNDWCYQHGTNEQYTKCSKASEDGRPVITQQLGMGLPLVVGRDMIMI